MHCDGLPGIVSFLIQPAELNQVILLNLLNLTFPCNAHVSLTGGTLQRRQLLFECDVSLYFTFSHCTLSPSVKMSGPKKRKVGSECRVFNSQWTKYIFHWSPINGFLIEYNISHNLGTKLANCTNEQSTQERVATAQRLTANLQTQQKKFHRLTAIHFAGIQISKG